METLNHNIYILMKNYFITSCHAFKGFILTWIINVVVPSNNGHSRGENEIKATMVVIMLNM